MTAVTFNLGLTNTGGSSKLIKLIKRFMKILYLNCLSQLLIDLVMKTKENYS